MTTRMWGLVVAFVAVVLNHFLNRGRDELYHLADDPRESTNLIDSDSPAAKQAFADLNRRILEQMDRLADPTLPLAKSS